MVPTNSVETFWGRGPKTHETKHQNQSFAATVDRTLPRRPFNMERRTRLISLKGRSQLHAVPSPAASAQSATVVAALVA